MKKSPRSLDAIIEQQVRRWELAQQARRRADQAAKQVHPVIAVSRQFGSRGAALARKVADALELSFWDRELLNAISENRDATEQIANTLDEHRRDAIIEMVAVFGAHRPVTAEDYHQRLARVVHTIADHGDAVIVGRGAQYFLKADTTLRVRAVGAPDARIKGLMTRRAISESEARKLIKSTDADRHQFIREHFDRDSNEPTEYDLIVNTGTLPLQVAADAVVAAYRARFGAQVETQAR